jgi:DNA repair exonuclease SbcCD ATPase subunit
MPDPVHTLALRVLVIVFGVTSALQTWRLHGTELALAQTRTEQATQQAQQSRQAQAQSEAYRQLEQHYREQITQIETQAQAVLAQAQLALGRAHAAGQRLQHELAHYLDQHRPTPTTATPASPCPPDPTALDLLAELFRRADERAGELAAIADEARVRGGVCEAAYDAAYELAYEAVQTSPN